MNNINLSWKNVEAMLSHEDSDELFEELCAKSTASDFYFDVRADPYDKIPTIIICPKDYFDDNGYCFAEHLNIDHLLDPDVYEEIMEATYVVEGRSIKSIKDDLSKLGFVSNQKFSDFLSENEESFSETDEDEADMISAEEEEFTEQD